MHLLKRRLLTGSLMLLVASAGMPALASDRLDPEERMRLRGELRRHAWEDRMRGRESWRGAREGGVAGVPPAGVVMPPPGGRYEPRGPGPAGMPGYRGRSGHGGPAPDGLAPGYGGPAPGYGGPSSGYGGPPPGHGASPAGAMPGQAGAPRLSPEERQALRRQLREARRHGAGDPSGGR